VVSAAIEEAAVAGEASVFDAAPATIS
jgi:hypothetical protein